MIRVHKDLTNIPNSLLDRTTDTKRTDCIRNSRYKQDKNFNRRFKQRDVKVYLKRIYNKKCSFCEQKVIDSVGTDLDDNTSTIDHYRPKSVYFWLAYSWDNLLWCCHRCNQKKDNKFEIMGSQINYNVNFLNNIHNSSSGYNITEQPKIIHPEFENVLLHLIFNANGKIDSNDLRVKYTITTCAIDRSDLNEKRKKILDEFKAKINARKLLNNSYDDIVLQFTQDMKNKYNEFLAYRYWILQNINTLL